MFSHKGDNHSELLARRRCLIREMQNTARQSIKKRVRSEMLRQLNQEQLNELISKPQSEFSKQDLAELVRFANSQFVGAVAHLGNLVLDGVVKIGQVEKVELRLGFHPHWLWLIEVLVEKEYCTTQMIQHCIKSMSPKRSAQTIKKALTILYKLTLATFCSLQLFNNEQFLLSVLNSCFLENEVSEIAFGLVYELIRKSAKQQMQHIITQKVVFKLQSIVQQGSLCDSRKIKIMTCRILIELSKKDIFLPSVCPVIQRMLAQAKRLRFFETMIDLLMVFVLLGRQEQILTLIEGGMLVELGRLKQELLKDEENEYAASQIVELSREIKEKTKNSGILSKGVNRELQRFHLLSVSSKMDICSF